MTRPAQQGALPERGWTLLTNHGRILLMVARDPELRIRDLAAAAGVTDRTAHTIVNDLESAGYVTRSRVGRRNTYVVNLNQPFRHAAEAGHTIGELVELFQETR